MDLTLISIVVGLGLTELLLSFGRLVRARARVTWDALPLGCAALIIALAARSRRWDWFALALVAAAYALRLVTQIAH